MGIALVRCLGLFLCLTFTVQTASASRIVSLSGSLSFGNVPTGSSTQRSLTISNLGSQKMTVKSITYPVGFSGAFSGSINAGASQIVPVTFSPAAPTNYGGTVTVSCNNATGVNTIPVSGVGTGAPPTRIIALGGNLAFGNALVGSSTQRTLSITNKGSSTLHVTNIVYPAGFSGSFSGLISPGASHNVTVTFSPVSAAVFSGKVTVVSDKTSGTNTISISGTGTNPPPTRIIALSGNLAFGSIAAGSSSQSTLVISNRGNTTLTINSISYPAGFSGAFSGTIAAGAAHNVAVTFAPGATGSFGGTVTVSSDKTSGGNTIAISGTATNPPPTRVIALSGSLVFGSVLAGSSTPLTLVISNTGNATLTVSNIDYPTGFSGDFPSGTIAAGAAHNVTVTFSPNTAGGFGGTITVGSDATAGVNTVAASGTATNPPPTRILSLSGDLDFGNVGVGAFASLTLAITNSGNTNLTVNSIDYPGGFTGDFSSGMIGPGESTNVTVTFTPLALTNYSGTITVHSDATSGTNTVTASGAGIPLPSVTRIIALSGDLDFGNVQVGQVAHQTLVISNLGNAMLTISNLTFPAGFSGDFSSGIIAAGATQSVSVAFTPVAATDYSGAVTIDSDGTGTNAFNVMGTGFQYVPSKSKFNGLFYPTDGVDFTNSGYVQAVTSTKSTFSAKFTLAGSKYSFSGRFSASGALSGQVIRKGLTPLTLTIQAGFDGGDVWKGTLSDGVWTADITADRAVFGKLNPAPAAGVYALTIAGSSDALQAPTTNGTGVLAISSTGAAKFAGILGDGAKFAQVTAVSKDGQLPFAAFLYTRRGSILGWLNVTNDPGHEVVGTVDWFKLSSVDPVAYPSGFFFQTTVSGVKQ
jgi:uncharacterized membrane protein